MIRRLLTPSKNSSFFLLGARGTGKSTLLEHEIAPYAQLSLNLLLPSDFDPLLRNPQSLLAQIEGLSNPQGWVIIDEVQKLPALLDIVHHAIEKFDTKFALTGSSARKLIRGQANLLAGRAFVYHLFPFTYRELDSAFSLEEALNYGTLPKISEFQNSQDKELFLTAYAHTYLKEEIQAEQVVRTLSPFRRFLEIAAQVNGSLINFSAVARDVGSDDKTVKSYFQILEDTLIGFFLPAYHRSVRKTQLQAPRFFLFDCGIKRALEGTLTSLIQPSTSTYGAAFEHFIITEMVRLNSYGRKNFRFFYLRTQAGAEIDLIVERPGNSLALVEIKSTTDVREDHLKHLHELSSQFENPVCLCLSRDKKRKRFGSTLCLPWEEGIEEIGL
jgi:uncharacterized protein